MKSRKWISFVLATMMIAVGAGIATAEEHDADAAEESTRHLNEFALFAGVTDERSEDPVASLGLEYTRKLGEIWGIGGIAEFAFGDAREFVLAVPVCLWPTEHLKLILAPGIEFSKASDEEGESEGEDGEREKEFLVRLGVGYGFELNEHFGIEPAIDLDFVDGSRTIVYGINFTYAW